MAFLDTLTVVSLGVREAEQSLLEKVTRTDQYSLAQRFVSTHSFSFQNENAILS